MWKPSGRFCAWVVAASAVWASGPVVVAREQAPSRRLALTVQSRVALKGDPQPVTGGIPFPRGALSRSDQVRLLDAAGTELPLQTEVLATWDREGEQVRWLLLDLQPARLKSGQTHLTLVYGSQDRRSGEDAVDPRESDWPPDEIIGGLYLIDQHGSKYRADVRDKETLVETETAGPLRTVVRVHVWHKDDQGQRLCRAILRLHYYAGLEQVRIFHSLVMDADPEQVKIRGLGLELPGPSGAQTVLLSGEQQGNQILATEGPTDLFQDRDDHFAVSGNRPHQGRRSGTWLCVVGEQQATGVFVRNGWEEFPKRLKWSGDYLDVQLWPTDGCSMLDLGAIPQPIIAPTTESELRSGLAKHPSATVSLYRFVTKGQTDWTTSSVVPLMRRARELEAELLGDRFAYYYLVFGHNGRGSMKTHEIVVAKLAPDVDPEQLSSLATRVRFPPVLSAAPAWNCSTGAFGASRPYGESGFTDVDRAMTYEELKDTAKFREQLHLYGARDFGDYLNGNPATAGALYRVYGAADPVRITQRIGWMNNESQDSTVGAWLQFLRTADPQIFYRAEAACEHIASVDQQHLFPTPARHLAVSFYHTLNHHDGGPAASHTLNSGYLLGYYLTGDRALRETAIANADYFLDRQQRDATGWYAGVNPSRQNIAPLTCVLNAYTLTWEQKYLQSLDRFLAVWAPVYDVTKHYLGGTLPYPGAEFARLVEHRHFQDVFHRIMGDLRVKKDIDGQSPYYMPGMVAMWETTGDASYLAYCRLVFQWYRHNLQRQGHSDSVRRLVLGLPDFKYGMVSGYLAAGLAGIEKARAQGIDLDAAAEKLRADRSGQLYYSVYGTVEGKPGRWYPPGSSAN